ncbi:MAG: YggT family protein [Bacillota bacterium]|nr:YggT family protein [Bacillota bacterium]
MVRGIIYILLEIYELIIVARCVCSFILVRYNNRFYDFLCNITDPVLEPVRKVLGKFGLESTSLDFSPIIVMLLIGVILRCL